MQRYESYKSSGLNWLGDIPAHWNLKKSKFLWREKEDRSLLGDEELLSVSQYSGVVPRAEDSRSESLEDYKRCEKNDLVINIMLAWMSGLGVSKHSGIVSPSYCVYRQLEAHNPSYFDYLYRTPQYLAEFARRSKGVVPSRWRMYTEDFGQVLSLLPPREEQDRIVAFLDQKAAEIDDAIAKKERLIELLQEQKAVLVRYSVTRGIDHNVQMQNSGINWIGQIPEGWALSSIGLYARVSNGSTPSRDNSSYWLDGAIPWLSSGSVNDYNIFEPSEYITERAYKNTSLRIYHPGTVVIGIVGQGKTRGTSALMRISACINQNMAAIEPNSKLDPEFLHLYLVGYYDQIRGGGQGSNQEALNCDSVKKFPLLIPPISEQKLIVSHVNCETKKIDSSIRIASTQIDHLQELRRILVADCVIGKMKI